MSLTVQNLCKTYPTRGGELAVLRGVNLTLHVGEALAILGPSGSGKSTLLYLLGTLERPTSGTYRLGQQEPFTLTDAALAHFRNRAIGFVFQDHHLLPQCSVLENVLIPTLAGAAENLEARARELLDRVGLAHRLDHRPAELSGGERQRVAVARALIHKPMLLLADEPTGNLDRKTAQSIGQLLLEMHQQEKNILIAVTHSADLAKTLPRQVEMLDGSLADWTGTPDPRITERAP
ncbi:MAG: ABC transporter ATP-binding protein [Planctomycetes bacterium]|nr:ABC transporter ATP-binding protein [Planctomycetota bacterium]